MSRMPLFAALGLFSLLAGCAAPQTPPRAGGTTVAAEVPERQPTQIFYSLSAAQLCRDNIQWIPPGVDLDAAEFCEKEQFNCPGRPKVIQVSVKSSRSTSSEQAKQLRDYLNEALGETNRFVVPLDLASEPESVITDTRVNEFLENGKVYEIKGVAPADFRDYLILVTPEFRMENPTLRMRVTLAKCEKIPQGDKIAMRCQRRNDFNLAQPVEVKLDTQCIRSDSGTRCTKYGLMSNAQVMETMRSELMDKAARAFTLKVQEMVPVTMRVTGWTPSDIITLNKGREEGLTGPNTVILFQRLNSQTDVAVAAAEVSPGQRGRASGKLCWLDNPEAAALKTHADNAAASRQGSLGGFANNLYAVTNGAPRGDAR
ncbi:MAG: hypothetical protein HQL56_17210 [Magnetococcales bacterium]|nr:hypothetical protein [Magnetococcales bacterium]